MMSLRGPGNYRIIQNELHSVYKDSEKIRLSPIEDPGPLTTLLTSAIAGFISVARPTASVLNCVCVNNSENRPVDH